MYEELKEFSTIMLCPSVLCNLNCKYCYIEKNSDLNKYEKKIIDSFKDEDYYFNFITSTIPSKNQITTLEFWGAEVSLYLDRTIYTCKKLIEYYPNLQKIFFSTNLISDRTLEQFKILLDLFKLYPYRKFVIELQISLDGPEEITDFGRGKGTTNNILTNINKLIYNKGYLEDSTNIQIILTINSTLDSSILEKFINSDYIINYYKFFEEVFYKKYYDLCKKDCRFIFNGTTVPKFVTPYSWTPSDGIILKEICQICREQEKSIRDKLDIYDDITPYRNVYNNYDLSLINPSYNTKFTFCGAALTRLSFLPNHLLFGCSSCYNGKGLPFDKEKSNIKNKTPLLFKDIEEVRKFIDDIIDNNKGKNGNPFLYNGVCLITNLAKSGLIDKDLINEEKALRALLIISKNTNTACLYNAMNDAKTYMGNRIGEYMFFLNGAYKYFYKFADGRLLNDVYDQL